MPCFPCCVQFVPLSVSNLSCRLSFLLSLDNLLDFNLHLMFVTFHSAVGTALSVLLIIPCCWVCFCSLRSAVLFCLLLAVLFCLLLAVSFCLLLAVLFCLLTSLCHFVQLSELLVDLLLVVVQVLRLCAPFRQSGSASVVDFFSPLALLAVVLSLFSVFWRRLLQHYFVVVYCSEVRLKYLQRHLSVCAAS